MTGKLAAIDAEVPKPGSVQDHYTRALKGAAQARDQLRKAPGNDMNLDHWAARLLFWKDEERRMLRIAEQDGHGLSEVF